MVLIPPEADLFGIDEREQAEIVGEVTAATDRWRETAQAVGIRKAQIERMEPAFDHEQREIARGVGVKSAG